MWNLENGTDEPVCRAEIEAQMQRTNVWTSRGESGSGWWWWCDELGDGDRHVYTDVYKMDD